MKSFKIRVQGADHPSIKKDQRIQSSCTRVAYNDFVKRGLTLTESRSRCSGLFKIGYRLVDAAVRRASWILKGVKGSRKLVKKGNEERKKQRKNEAARLKKKFRKEGVNVNAYKLLWKREKKKLKRRERKHKGEDIKKEGAKNKKKWRPQFGDFKRRSKGLISKEQYRQSKLLPLLVEGEADRKGNRYFEIDIEKRTIVYKRSKDEHIELKIVGNISKTKKRELERLVSCIEERKTPVTVSISGDYVVLSYNDELLYAKDKKEEKKELNPNRVMALDLNPNYIGVAVLERGRRNTFKILGKNVYDLRSLNAARSGNKRRYELVKINHMLMRSCRHYRVGKVAVEALHMLPGNRGYGKRFNRICNSGWNRRTTILNLKALCNMHGQDFVEVNACYSSIVGNIIHGNETTPDMVAAAIELALRAPTKNFAGRVLPDFNKSKILSEAAKKYGNRWKEVAWMDVRSWADLNKQIKNLELKYRVSLENTIPRGQRLYRKMLVIKSSYI